MKRQINIFGHFGVALLIVTACNGQINLGDQNPGFSVNVEPNFGLLNNLPAPPQGNGLSAELNITPPIFGVRNEGLNDLNVVPPNVDFQPENNLPSIDDVRPGNEVPSVNGNSEDLIIVNAEPPKNDLPVNNNVPSIEEVRPDNEVPSVGNNLEGLNNDNVEPPKNEDSSNTNVPSDEEVTNNGKPESDNLPPETGPSVNEDLNNENIESPEIDNPSKDEEESNNPNDENNTTVVTYIEPESDVEDDNLNNNGNGNHGHGDHQRLRCKKRFGYFKIDGYCDKYVECKNYRPRRKICPDGMYFNENALWSEYPCGYPSDIQTPCRSRNAPSSHSSPYCPHQYGFFPYESQDIRQKCYQYIMCSGGAPNVMTCPESLVFNAKVGRCDWPEQVPECDVIADFRCPGEYEAEDYVGEDLDVSVVRNYKHENRCSYFWSCLRGQARLLRCDYGMIFDPNYGRCVVDEFGSCHEYYYPDPQAEDIADD